MITSAALGITWALFILAFAWPTIALFVQCAGDARVPQDGFAITARQLGLLWRSLWLAGVGTVLCLLISLPIALVFGRVRRIGRRPMLLALLTTTLLAPPMVYAFGWERILPASFDPHLRCIGVWALWAWPIPALILAAGWARVGQAAQEAALMSTSAVGALVRVGLPSIWKHIALAGFILFVLFFNDYGVPHACGLLVYATELLGWAASSPQVIDTLWPAIPGLALTFILLLLVLRLGRSIGVGGDAPAQVNHAAAGRRSGLSATIVYFLICWVVPMGALIGEVRSLDFMAEAFTIYGSDLAWSVGVATAAAALALLVGLGLTLTPRLAKGAALWALALGLLPGALIGKALVAAYNVGALAWLYDHWPILVVCYLARFGWIGIAAAMVMNATTPDDVIRQARADGAGRWSVLMRVQIPLHWPTLLAGFVVVGVRALADVAASSMVRVPSFSPIAHVLIEKFHRFETEMLVALSLWLVVAAVPAVMLISQAMRCRGQDG